MAVSIRSRGVAAALMFAAMVGPSALLAQDAPEDDSGLRQNCVGDYFRFCSSYLPGSSEIRRCFAANTDNLTPACRGAIRCVRSPQRNTLDHSACVAGRMRGDGLLIAAIENAAINSAAA